MHNVTIKCPGNSDSARRRRGGCVAHTPHPHRWHRAAPHPTSRSSFPGQASTMRARPLATGPLGRCTVLHSWPLAEAWKNLGSGTGHGTARSDHTVLMRHARARFRYSGPRACPCVLESHHTVPLIPGRQCHITVACSCSCRQWSAPSQKGFVFPIHPPTLCVRACVRAPCHAASRHTARPRMLTSY